MKKVFKFVKGKKDEKKESGGITPSHSGDLISPAQTPEDERFLGLDNSSGYIVDFCGKDKSLTKLHKAAWQGSLEKLKSALKKVEIDTVDRHNRTALHFAVVQGHPNIVWYLLGNNAKTAICDDEGRTPLLKAIECGHRECMSLLLERGTDINVADYTGNTGLHIATNQGSLETVSALLKKGADTEISNNAGDYPLHIATKLENKDLVDLFLNSGASVDVLDRENRTPLMLAAKNGNLLLTQLFVEKGAQLSIVDSNNWTALDYAILAGHESVAAALKSINENKNPTNENSKSEDEEASSVAVKSDENSGSWSESKTEKSDKNSITQKLKEFFKKCSEDTESEKEKGEEAPDSPNEEVMPPYCQPPKSWEMIQAGMIDEDKGGTVPKRRSITALGTLHSRRESFTEGLGASSPKHTLSLNRRKQAKVNNSFAKQRFSFNEEESLKYWMNEDKAIRKDLEKVESENLSALESEDVEKKQSTSESDWDSMPSEEAKSEIKSEASISKSGTFGRSGTMQGGEEIWVENPHISPKTSKEEQSNSWDSEDQSEKDGNFPPPPSALELGVDMAKSIKYMKGVSMDRPLGNIMERNLWKTAYESHSLDCLEEKDFTDGVKGNTFKGHARHQSTSNPKWRSDEIPKCQKPADRLVDVNKRISEQLECYDQALRELAETTTTKKWASEGAQNYYSLPYSKSSVYEERRKTNSLSRNPEKGNVDSGPYSLPNYPTEQPPLDVENNEKLGLEPLTIKPGEKLEKKTKRHMLLAMREVKHAVHVTNTFKTSLDDQILSPLTKPDNSFDLEDKPSPGSEGTSPGDENPFFGVKRQETVMERNEFRRKSSSSGTGEEPTLWLQDDLNKKTDSKNLPSVGSDEDISDISDEAETKHKRMSSFSPLGVIYREIQKESQTSSQKELEENREDLDRFEGNFGVENEEVVADQSPDISLSSGPIEPLGIEKDSGSDPESSHNDVTPTHNYSLKAQHEWLKCHLKTATTEKNKLEEITAQLSEKTERLQYELADAKEAARSRDEVIHLLQGQLARMEAAYTKSLEESVQSRLQLTSHEQEILHLKELCYKYEEEKDNAAAENVFEELESKIKALEEEKKKMKEEIHHLEQEKSLLEKRLKETADPEILDQCKRWKERCEELEDLTKTLKSQKEAYDCYLSDVRVEQQQKEKELKEKNLAAEKKYLEASEENLQLKCKLQNISIEMEAERRNSSSKNELNESFSELKKKNVELEVNLKKLEREIEDKFVNKLKDKEDEIQMLVKQFNSERESLVAGYEKKLMEKKSEHNEIELENCKKENEKLKQMMKNLQDQVLNIQMKSYDEDAKESLRNELSELKFQCNVFSKSIVEMQSKDQHELNSLMTENLKLKKEIMETKVQMIKDSGDSPQLKLELMGIVSENSKMKSEILELKNQVNTLTKLLDRKSSMETERLFKNPKFDSDHRLSKKRSVGKEDELAWSSLYGMKAGRSRVGRSSMVDLLSSEGENTKQGEGETYWRLLAAQEEKDSTNRRQGLELLELKKEILSLQNKMSDEESVRQALETKIVEMNLDLKEKNNLEQEIISLKRKIDRDCVQRSEMELLQYQKDLEMKKEKLLEKREEKEENDKFRIWCEMLAKEREKAKEIKAKFGQKSKSLETVKQMKLTGIPARFYSYPQAQSEILQIQSTPSFVLEPELKIRLEEELERSIQKYVKESSSQSIASVQVDLLNKSILPKNKQI